MDQDELLELIEKAAVEEWTELDLNHWGLTELPPEITQLTSLETLMLSANILTTIPPEIWKLTNLTSLDLTKNLLSEIPSKIKLLKNLISLDLRNEI